MSQALADRPAAPCIPPHLAAELAAGRRNGCVGTRLLSVSERSRVWTIELKPGDRIGFHTHVLDYFWTAVTPGRARSHYGDGRVAETEYRAGDIQTMTFGAGKSMTHDLANVGDTDLIFTTVEYLDSANPPLDLPEAVLREADAAVTVRI